MRIFCPLCIYCANSSPYQTHAYKEKERINKERGYDSEEEAERLEALKRQKLAEQKLLERRLKAEEEAAKKRAEEQNIARTSLSSELRAGSRSPEPDPG